MMRDRRGMTLMELVIALVITGLMATAGETAFASIVDHRRDIVRATQDTERAAALREMIRGWLVSGTVSVTQGTTPQGTNGRSSTNLTSQMRTVTPGGTTTAAVSVTAAVASGDELDFTTNAPNPALSAQARMRLFVDGDNSTPETGLTVEYQANAQAPLQRRQLEASIGTLTVEFLDSRTNRWYDATQAAAITPMAVRVTLGPLDGAVLPRLLTLPIVLPMGDQAATRPGGTAN